jgi:hypothetical protein
LKDLPIVCGLSQLKIPLLANRLDLFRSFKHVQIMGCFSGSDVKLLAAPHLDFLNQDAEDQFDAQWLQQLVPSGR